MAIKGNIYFAHPMSDYGRIAEERALNILQDIFRVNTIINPGDPIHDPIWDKLGMKAFDKFFLPQTEAIVFMGFPDGPVGKNSIGSGVAWELDAYADFRYKNGLTTYIYEWDRRGQTITKRNWKSWDKPFDRIRDRYETRALIRKYGKKR